MRSWNKCVSKNTNRRISHVYRFANNTRLQLCFSNKKQTFFIFCYKRNSYFLLRARYVSNVAYSGVYDFSVMNILRTDQTWESTWEVDFKSVLVQVKSVSPNKVTPRSGTDRPVFLENFKRPYLGNRSSDPLPVWF